jgi:hypothetical protein
MANDPHAPPPGDRDGGSSWWLVLFVAFAAVVLGLLAFGEGFGTTIDLGRDDAAVQSDGEHDHDHERPSDRGAAPRRQRQLPSRPSRFPDGR